MDDFAAIDPMANQLTSKPTDGSSRHQHSHRRKRSPSPSSRKHSRHDRDDDKDRSKNRDKDSGSSSHRKKSHRNEDKERSPESERRHQDKKRQRKDEKKEARQQQGGMRIEDDDDDAGVWIEKSVDNDPTASIPTNASFALTSHATQPTTAQLPASGLTSFSKRESWMMEDPMTPLSADGAPASSQLDDGGVEARAAGGGTDFFTALGTQSSARQEKEAAAKQVKAEEPRFHRREINHRLVESETGNPISSTSSVSSPNIWTSATKTAITPGAPGSQWRMTKLRKTYELAQAESRPLQEVAIERYGSIADFEEAVEERRVLDERANRRDSRGSGGGRGSGTSTPGGARREDGEGGRERYMFTSDAAMSGGPGSRPGSRAGFRRPGEDPAYEAPSTPSAVGLGPTTGGGSSRVDLLRRSSSFQQNLSTSSSGPSSPIPSVIAPVLHRAPPVVANDKPPLSPRSLNKLQARAIKAGLMGDEDERIRLEGEYETEKAKTENGAGAASRGEGSAGRGPGAAGDRGNGDEKPVAQVKMLPTIDGMGRMYDVGAGKKDGEKILPGNRRPAPKKVETRDPKTGDLIRLNADDDTTTLGDLVRAEKFGAGSADQKNMDAEMARAIAADSKYQADLDYLDENADRLARKKMKTDASKRLFAINDYARTKKALDNCMLCPNDDDASATPRAAVIAMGTRAYLACTQTEELVEGHCLIVPLQHTLTTLEGDDDVWDEIRNFMKTLMKMFAEQDKGVLFYETVLSFKQQRHTYIEAVPVPWDLWDDAPAYFREAILASEAEWSQHKKLIDFSARPGGFRRSLVSNLPYFMIQWDYKGEKGYGHVIEGMGDSSAKQGDGEDMGAVDEGDKGGGEFPRYFAAEIIGTILDLEPRRWRKPRFVSRKDDSNRVAKFLKAYAKHDWTGMLGGKSGK